MSEGERLGVRNSGMLSKMGEKLATRIPGSEGGGLEIWNSESERGKLEPRLQDLRKVDWGLNSLV